MPADVTVDGLPRADHECCLWNIGSINTPKCIVQWQKEIIMGKRMESRLDDSPPGACAGRSLIEMLEDQLDGYFNTLKGLDMETADPLEVADLKGAARGVAESIAILLNPYYPNVDVVRAEAVERWEWREAHPEIYDRNRPREEDEESAG